MGKIIPSSLMLVLLTGCVSHTQSMNDLSTGMTKQQVVKIMGNPHSTSAQGRVEYLNYKLFPKPVLWDVTPGGGGEPYFVRLVDGKVESYGRAGDFDSTKDPTVNVNVTHK